MPVFDLSLIGRACGLLPVKILLLALVCAVGAGISAFFTVEPDAMRLIAPEAGIALGALLVCGYRLWPGLILAGLWIGWRQSEEEIKAISLILPAVGLTLQAAAGAWLIRRFGGFPHRLETAREITVFLLFGGPVACALSALLMVLLSPETELSQAVSTGFAYWLAGSAGVVLFAAPTLLLSYRKEDVPSLEKVLLSLVFAGFFVVAGGFFLLMGRMHVMDMQETFRLEAEEKYHGLQRAVQKAEEILTAIQAFYAASHSVERVEFRLFVRRFIEKNPEIQGLAWIPRVPGDERILFEQLLQREGYQNGLYELGEGKKKIPAATRSDYYPIYYSERAGNGKSTAYGFDMGSNTERRQAMLEARDTARIMATPPVTLLSGQKGIVLFIPVYRNGTSVETVAQRRENLLGFAAGVFYLDTLVGHVLPPGEENGIGLTMSGEFSPAGGTWTYHAGRSHSQPFFTEEHRMMVGGQVWQTVFTSSPVFSSSFLGKESIWRLLSGLGLSILMVFLALIILGRNSLMEKRIRERTIELEESREQYSLAVRGSSVGLWDWNLQKNTLYWSARLREMLGLEERDVTGTIDDFMSRLHPEDKPCVEELLERHFKDHQAYDTEFRLRHQNGAWRWMHARGQALWDEEGRVTRMSGSVDDITEAKRVREEVYDQRQELKLLFDNIRARIWYKDDRNNIVRLNRMAAESMGGVVEDFEGKNVYDLFPAMAEKYHEDDLKVIREGKPQLSVIEPYIAAEEEKKWSLTDKIPYFNEKTNSRSVLVVSNDITELMEARQKAEEATQLKSEFLANMSHEIRTPMNGVIGMTNLLLETELDNTQHHYTMNIAHSAETLLELVNDILDFSKIEAGKMALDPIEMDLERLVEEVVDLLAVKADEKNVALLMHVPPDMPRRAVGDPNRIRQIFLNLVSNALKFTSEGHILVKLEATEVTPEAIVYCAEVMDTGIGIPKDKQEYIFNKFNQADGSTTRKFGGTGLGLAICRELTRMMGGEIGVTSRPYEGSRFWFTVRLARAEEEPEKAVEPAVIEETGKALKGLRVAVLDEKEESRKIIGEVLEGAGMQLQMFDRAEEMLRALDEADKEENVFDAILVGHLPVPEEALTLAQRIRKRRTMAELPLLLMACHSYDNEQALLKDAGYSGYLHHPAPGRSLVAMMKRLTGVKGGGEQKLITKDMLFPQRKDAESAGSRKRTLYFGGARILLVEDNKVNQFVAESVLSKYGCKVTVAENGAVGVQYATSEPFDLIFMDCQMPEMDGFEATSLIRHREALKGEDEHIPIVAFTANARKSDEEKCLESGMDDFLAKPIRQESLEEILKRWLPAAADPSIAGEQHKQEETPMSQVTQEERQVIQEDIFEDIKQLGEVHMSLLERYNEDVRANLDKIRAAIDAGDSMAVNRLAHSLKSSSRQVGALELGRIAEVLEKKGKVSDMNGMEALYDEFATAGRDVIRWFEDYMDSTGRRAS